MMPDASRVTDKGKAVYKLRTLWVVSYEPKDPSNTMTRQQSEM